MNSSSAIHITHAIFDLDGLLINTEEIYTKATNKIVHKFGKEFTMDVKVKLMGKSSIDACQVAVDLMGIPMTAQEFLDALTAETKMMFPKCSLKPGSEETVAAIYKAGVPMAIATGSIRPEYNRKIGKRHSQFFQKYFTHSTHASNEMRSKPAPDIFQICSRNFTRPPSSPRNVLVFEDSPNGVAGALVAGMYCLWVPSVPEAMEMDHFFESAVLKDAMTLRNEECSSSDGLKDMNDVVEDMKSKLFILESLEEFDIKKFFPVE